MKSMIKEKLSLCMQRAFMAVGVIASLGFLTACEDFFEQESEYVIYDGDNALDNAADTVYSVIGIINKMQAIADRTILLGEVRGDLVDVTEATNADLRDVAMFSIDSDNKYNNPRDYYAVINNCNYFIANVDTALKNNRNESIFLREYAAVKGFRAWTYLQLVLNYGEIPFITTPITTKDQADQQYERKDLNGVCSWLLQDLQGLEQVTTPYYGDVRGNDSRLFYFPIRLLQAELSLWLKDYRGAALKYYEYLTNRNGMNSTTPVTSSHYTWAEIADWNTYIYSSIPYTSEAYGNELITMIPGDSIPAEGVFLELRGLFNTYSVVGNERVYNGPYQLTPSKGLVELSESQQHCVIGKANATSGYRDTLYAPAGLPQNASGDLRYSNYVTSSQGVEGNEQITTQNISKFGTRNGNVHIYRRTLVYLRMAEALNRAGYPHFAYQILATGVNDEVIEEEVMPHYSKADSIWLSQFSFPNLRYKLVTSETFAKAGAFDGNTIGIHSRGSGYTPANKFYQMPMPSEPLESPEDTINFQIEAVEDLIVDEAALEFALEGIRFYDLMRVALRRDDPTYLAEKVYGRKGETEISNKSGITVDLTDPKNWYLNWNGQIGYGQ